MERADPDAGRAGARGGLTVGVLGVIEARRDGVGLDLGGLRPRALLALLAMQLGETAPVERLVDRLWGERPPATAIGTIRSYVSRLRRALHSTGEPESLVTSGPGYALVLPKQQVDACWFEALLDEARAAAPSDPTRALTSVREALSLWRGPAYADVAYEEWARAEVERLEELRLTALELRFEIDLDLGKAGELIGELQGLVRRHPHREGLLAQLMLAYCRANRQAEALLAYRHARRAMRDELGLEPSRHVQNLHQAILRQDASLAPVDAVAVPAAPAGEPGGQAAGDATTAATARLGADPVQQPLERDERKVVSVLFCDLVGWTGIADEVDPEDVSRLLRDYHATVGAQIIRFGGGVEKFIGDAVVGVWGAPIAHEDDAERAVRAALAVLDAVDGDVRIAVNTGEALVRLSDEPASHDFGLVGDVMNTAARLQAVAPSGGVIVGEATVRASDRTIAYQPLTPVQLKGKSQPVSIWLVEGLRRDVHERGISANTPFVGRQSEFDLLDRLFDRALGSSAPQLVTVTGEPGAGKTRLVSEVVGSLRRRNDGVMSLRGVCPAYGQRIGFAPLSEALRTYLGVLQVDTPAEARDKLARGTAGMRDSAWLNAHLAPLLGLGGEGSDRQEVFGAWQRLFEEVAQRQPLVLIFEDLHWADQGTLAFIDYLLRWSTDVPLMVLTTARPELFDTHPGWAGGLANSTTVALGPLSEEHTKELLAALLDAGSPSEIPHAVTRRVDGNPLYAEEYARLLRERPTAVHESEVPISLQAIIAARIDTLPYGRKALLHDAAVIGKVFWAGAIASLNVMDARALRSEFRELARKELIRRSRVSSVADDEEYVFWHDLVRDVAYSQIPRSARAAKHRDVADWIVQTAGDRIADRAELVARHYLEALKFAQASAEPVDEDLTRAAVRHLEIAGERAIGMDRGHAEALLGEALGLVEPDAPEHPRILCRLAECAFQTGRPEEARALAEQARVLAEARGDIATLGDALYESVEISWLAGDGRFAREQATAAIERLEQESPTRALGRVLGWSAFFAHLDGQQDLARQIATRALETADALQDALGVGFALMTRGVAAGSAGDESCFVDCDRAVDVLVGAGSSMAPQARNNRADLELLWHGSAPALQVFDDAIEHAERTRMTTWAMWLRGESTWALYALGDWDELLRRADHVLTWDAEAASQVSLVVAPLKARVMALRGDLDASRLIIGSHLESARLSGDVQMVAPTLTTFALIEHLDGRHTEVIEILSELRPEATRSPWAPTTEICRLLIAHDRAGEAQAIVRGLGVVPPRTAHAIASVRAMLAEADGQHDAAARAYTEAASRWSGFGHSLEHARALAGRSRCLAALGRPDDACSRRVTQMLDALAVRDHAGAASIIRPASLQNLDP